MQVMVTVTDENDNAPTFTQSQYLIHVPDPMAPGMCLSLPPTLSEVSLLLNGLFLPFKIKYLSSILWVYFPEFLNLLFFLQLGFHLPFICFFDCSLFFSL